MNTKKETVGNKVRRTGGSMFNSIKTIKANFLKSSPWFGFNNEFKEEVGVVWQSINPNRSERRKHYKYRVRNKSVDTSHPKQREGLKKQYNLNYLRGLRLNTCKELKGSF